jgi:hypothetical protein
MSAPGNSILIIAFIALFVACCGYAAGRIHQRRHFGRDREAAYRDGYEKGTRSVFSLAARVIVPRRSGVRVSGSAKARSTAGGETTRIPPAALPSSSPSGSAGAGSPPVSPGVGSLSGLPGVGSPSADAGSPALLADVGSPALSADAGSPALSAAAGLPSAGSSASLPRAGLSPSSSTAGSESSMPVGGMPSAADGSSLPSAAGVRPRSFEPGRPLSPLTDRPVVLPSSEASGAPASSTPVTPEVGAARAAFTPTVPEVGAARAAFTPEVGTAPSPFPPGPPSAAGAPPVSVPNFSLTDAAARSLAGAGMAELGFPVPPPPPTGTVPPPTAVGGVRYQRFPDPRTGIETTVLPDMRDKKAVKNRLGESPDGRRPLPRPSRPTSPASGLSFVPTVAGTATGKATDGSEDAGPGGFASFADTEAAGSEFGGSSGCEGATGAGASTVAVSSSDSPSGERVDHQVGPSVIEDPEDTEPLDADSAAGGRRGRRGAGHRAPEDEDDTVDTAEAPTHNSASSSGRHTVPDELVRAATYRLPPDRVFRAKVRDSATPSDDPTTRLVPKPRQS